MFAPRMTRGEHNRAALSKKDVAKKRPQQVISDLYTASDSDVERAAAAEARKNKERELKRKVRATEKENEALDRQLADAEAKKKAKLAQLDALRNSYPVT
jgi:hypothetical protein